MKITEKKAHLLARIIEGDAHKYLTSVGVISPEEEGYAKEVTFLNLLANTLIFRTVLEKEQGKIKAEQMTERLEQRMAHVYEKLGEVINLHIAKHVDRKNGV